MFAFLIYRRVRFLPIVVRRREGRSKIRPARDGLRFLHSVLKIGVLGNPIRFFYCGAGALLATAITYVAWNITTTHRLFIPNGAAILISLSAMCVVVAHVTDVARLILIVSLTAKRS
jgi:hypothetical protein